MSSLNEQIHKYLNYCLDLFNKWSLLCIKLSTLMSFVVFTCYFYYINFIPVMNFTAIFYLILIASGMIMLFVFILIAFLVLAVYLGKDFFKNRHEITINDKRRLLLKNSITMTLYVLLIFFLMLKETRYILFVLFGLSIITYSIIKDPFISKQSELISGGRIKKNLYFAKLQGINFLSSLPLFLMTVFLVILSSPSHLISDIEKIVILTIAVTLVSTIGIRFFIEEPFQINKLILTVMQLIILLIFIGAMKTILTKTFTFFKINNLSDVSLTVDKSVCLSLAENGLKIACDKEPYLVEKVKVLWRIGEYYIQYETLDHQEKTSIFSADHVLTNTSGGKMK